MNKINKYIDLCIIDEYANKDYRNGFSLDVETLPKVEIENLLSVLLDDDTEMRDTVLTLMQKMINERLDEVESKSRSNHYSTRLDRINGELILEGIRA